MEITILECIAAAAAQASEVITGSLLNARAVADYIRSARPERVSLVAMGVGASDRAEEDLICARYIRAMLRGEAWDEKAMAAEIEGLKSTTGRRFFDSATQDSMPEADFRLCTERDVFPFVIRAVGKEDFREMEAVPVGIPQS